jgi:hypothetical protein
VATSYYYNETDSPIRVSNGEGVNVRFPPGAVRAADGTLAENASGVEGLREASEDERNVQGQIEAGSRDLSRDQKLADVAAYARMMRISVPLNEVIGDDEAPYGPPSGTITTKQAAAREDPTEQGDFSQHFGPNEWQGQHANQLGDAEPAPGEPLRGRHVQAAQAKQSGAVEEATEAFQSGDDTDVTKAVAASQGKKSESQSDDQSESQGRGRRRQEPEQQSKS